MKIISGKLKGKKILGYDIAGTRPTMDRVKESVFAMIQDYVYDSVVLDLFSGSGNYGIESLSNGSKIVYFNDKNKECVKIIHDNLQNCHVLDNSVITNMDYQEALNYYQKKEVKFDLVFLDPPYKEHIINNIIDLLLEKKLLKKNSLVICELTNEEDYQSNQLILYKKRKYGEKIVLIYKLID